MTMLLDGVSDYYKINMLSFFFLSAYVSINYSKVNENGAKVCNYNLRNRITNCCEQAWEILKKGLAFKVKFEYHDE